MSSDEYNGQMQEEEKKSSQIKPSPFLRPENKEEKKASAPAPIEEAGPQQKGFFSRVKDIIQEDMIEPIKDYITKQVNGIKAGFKELVGDILRAGKAIANIKEDTQKAINSIAGEIDKEGQKIARNVNSQVEGIAKAEKKARQDISELVNKGTNQGIKSLGSQFEQHVQSVAANITNAFKSITNTFSGKSNSAPSPTPGVKQKQEEYKGR